MNYVSTLIKELLSQPQELRYSTVVCQCTAIITKHYDGETRYITNNNMKNTTPIKYIS